LGEAKMDDITRFMSKQILKCDGPAPSPIENGDFEHGNLDHWTTYTDTDCTVEVISGASYDGSYGCKLYAQSVLDSGDSYHSYITQDIDITDQMYFTFKYNIDDYNFGDGTNAKLFITATLEAEGIYEQMLDTQYSDPYDIPEGWNTVTYYVGNINGIVTFKFDVYAKYESSSC
jgi:hypothetical protein